MNYVVLFQKFNREGCGFSQISSVLTPVTAVKVQHTLGVNLSWASDARIFEKARIFLHIWLGDLHSENADWYYKNFSMEELFFALLTTALPK